MKWTIVVPGIATRIGQWPVVESLVKQTTDLDVEVLYLVDNCERSLGAKMGILYDLALGEYISTVADDDEVADNYVERIYRDLGNHDMVTFNVRWGSSGPGRLHANPRAVVRSSICKRFVWPDWYTSEDRAFAQWLRLQKPTHHHIHELLYTYLDRRNKPEFGGARYHPKAKVQSGDAVTKHIENQA